MHRIAHTSLWIDNGVETAHTGAHSVKVSRTTRLITWLLLLAFSALLLAQSFAHYVTYHNRTFDLALYARQAWGLSHGNLWEPIVGSHFFGGHVSVVLWPLGWLGSFFGDVGIVPVLLSAQAVAVGLTALPLARIGARRFGDSGALLAAFLWFTYPNISQVATYEFHPGNLALLPFAWALDALDARRGLQLMAACIVVLLCRADFALGTLCIAIVALWIEPQEARVFRRCAWALLILSSGYFLVQQLVLAPAFRPPHSSYDEHFSRWGGSPFGIVRALWTEPLAVWDHLSESSRVLYLPMVIAPLLGLPLFALPLCLPALPFLAINLISIFPTTTRMYSHYLTPAVPALIFAALGGLHRVCQRSGTSRAQVYGVAGMALACSVADVYASAYPWSYSFDKAAFVRDAHSEQAQRIARAVPPGVSVQAPDPLLPHLIERAELFRAPPAPPAERAADVVILDVAHRARFSQREDLLRTTEEPLARAWLARSDYGLTHAEPEYLMFERGRDFRTGPAAHYLTGQPASELGVPLTRCLSVQSAWLSPQGLELELSVHAPCPPDLALRISRGDLAHRVDLLFDGLLSPARLSDERVMSWHPLSEAERRAIVEHGLSLGALRANGAPIDVGDPVEQPIAVVR